MSKLAVYQITAVCAVSFAILLVFSAPESKTPSKEPESQQQETSKELIRLRKAETLAQENQHYYQNLPKTAEDAYQSLIKLQALSETGVGYRNYVAQYNETYSNFQLFQKSPEAKNLPLLEERIEFALKYYTQARDSWNEYVFEDNTFVRDSAKRNTEVMLRMAQIHTDPVVDLINPDTQLQQLESHYFAQLSD